MIRAERRVLSSGLTAIAVRREALHTVSVGAFVRVGTRYETREEQGLSHFLEHLLFRGSQRHQDSIEISREVERLGGSVDAWVHQEMTGYVIDVHRDHWREALSLLGELLLHPTFSDRQVDLERSIVIEEMGQYTDSKGDNVNLFDLVYQLMWGEGLAQADMTTLRRNLDAFDRERVLEFYDRYYTAGNMVVVLVGELEPEEALDRVETIFGHVKGGRTGSYSPARIGDDQPRSVVRYFETTQFDATLAMRAYSNRDERYPASTVLAEVLGGGTASRLFSRVREDLGLVYDIRAEVATFRDTGAITISTYCGRRNLEPTLNAILDVLEDLASSGVTAEELERARGLARYSADYLLDRPFELLEWYGRVELLDEPGGLLDPKREAERVARVGMDDVMRAIEDVLRPSNRYLAILGPVQGRQKRQVEGLFRRRSVAPKTAGNG